MGKHGPNHDLTRTIAQFPAPLGRKYPPTPGAFLHWELMHSSIYLGVPEA